MDYLSNSLFKFIKKIVCFTRQFFLSLIFLIYLLLNFHIIKYQLYMKSIVTKNLDSDNRLFEYIRIIKCKKNISIVIIGRCYS